MLRLEVMNACIPAVIGNLPETRNVRLTWNSVQYKYYYVKEEAAFSEASKLLASSMGSCSF